MPVYAFLCACGWNGDIRTTFDASNVECPECARPTTRESVYRVNFGGFARTPAEERDWSRDFKAFREASEDIDYKEQVATRTEGFTVQGPSLYQQAQAKAQDLLSKGAVDANDLS